MRSSRQDLEALRITALSTYLAAGGFESPYFRSSMQENFRRTPRLRLLAVYSRDDGFFYLLSANPDLLASGNRPQSWNRQQSSGSPTSQTIWSGSPAYQLRPLVHARISVPFSPGLQDNSGLPEGLLLDGVFLRLDREDLYPILKELFFVVLVYLIVTTILLLAAAVSPPEPREDRGVSKPGTRRLSPPESARQGLSPSGGRREPDSEQGGLYAPETGLGWRDFLPQRLSQELERAASFDQDLAFLLLAVKAYGPAGSPERRAYLYRQLAEFTLQSFPLKDLNFEYDAYTVAVILPERSLDQGLEEAKAFQRRLLQSSWAGFGRIRVYAGLSSRSGRLISGTRLLIEAGRSLKKAEAGGSNQIFAFRADPQKFRQVMFAGRRQ
jgi:GGDEF domain-containing protein